MNLILKCLDNDPKQRVHANGIVKELKKMVTQFPAFLQNKLEMQKYIKISEEDKRALREVAQEREKLIKQKEEENKNLSTHLQHVTESEINKINKMKLAHYVEVKELQLHAQHLKEDLRAKTSELEAVHTEIAILEKKLTEQLERLGESNQKAKAEFQASLTKERERAKQLLLEEKERGQKERQILEESLKKEISQLTRDITELQVIAAENGALKFTTSKLEEQISMKEAKLTRYIEEVKIKEVLLQKKDATIATVSEHLKKTREYMASKKQPIQVGIDWEHCADLPFAIAAGQSTVINGKVYFGGGITDIDDKRYLVHCYSPTENQWTTLPPLPVKWFGLGQINGKLVAVGGVKKDKKKQAMVYVFDSHKWKSTLIPPMEVARTFPAASSLSKLLVVAGGNKEGGHNTSTVEIFQQATSQWHKAASLPQACCNLTLISSGYTLYALGGYDQPSQLNQVLWTSIIDLYQEEDPTKPTWRTLHSSPSYQPAPVMLFGNLISVGGWQLPVGEVPQKRIYMYSATIDSWVYFGDLPEPCAWSTCAVLSATEILVIGGRNEEKVRAVYKGTLKVKA